MANKYVNFISDSHLLDGIENLYNAYIKAKEESSRTILDQITFENYSYYLGFDKP